MIDVSILRRAPEDWVREIPLFDGEEKIRVLYWGPDDHKRIRELATELIGQGYAQDEAYNVAYGRVALLGWSGLADGEGLLEFNQDNVDLLMLGAPEIRQKVITCASSLKVDARKN